jgi:hypothetical protein
VRGRGRSSKRAKPTVEEATNELQGSPPEGIPPNGQENPEQSGASRSGNGSGRKSGLPVTGGLTVITVIAAIAAIPSHAALIAFLFGIAAVAAGTFAWLLSGWKRGLCFGAAGVLLTVFFIVLLTNTPRSSGDSGTTTSPSLRASSSLKISTSPTSQRPRSPSPTKKSQPSPTPSRLATLPSGETNPKPVTVQVRQGHSQGFFGNRVLVGIDDAFDNFAAITVSTQTLSCQVNPDVGGFNILGVPADGYYRVTLLSVVDGKSATIKVQQVHVRDPYGDAYTC